jgi:hypothetical protein
VDGNGRPSGLSGGCGAFASHARDLAHSLAQLGMLELPQLARGIGLATWSAIATFHDRA